MNAEAVLSLQGDLYEQLQAASRQRDELLLENAGLRDQLAEQQSDADASAAPPAE